MDYEQLTKSIKHRKQTHLQASEDVLDEAVALAYANHCAVQRMPARHHFQLICFNENSPEYIYNLYPSTQRIYADPKHRGPFLNIKMPWTLLDVVKAKVGK